MFGDFQKTETFVLNELLPVTQVDNRLGPSSYHVMSYQQSSCSEPYTEIEALSCEVLLPNDVVSQEVRSISRKSSVATVLFVAAVCHQLH